MNEEINFEKYGSRVPTEKLNNIVDKIQQHQHFISAQGLAHRGYPTHFG